MVEAFQKLPSSDMEISDMEISDMKIRWKAVAQKMLVETRPIRIGQLRFFKSAGGQNVGG